MRLGILEVVVTIAVIIVIALIARISRTNRGASEQNKNAGRTHSYLKRGGIAFILVGIILSVTGISMFKWAVQSYVWSFIVVAIGLALVYLSRKK